MSKAESWAQRHQVVLFFALTYALSWASWAPYLLTRAEASQALLPVGIFGPALCCIIVSRVAGPGPRGGDRRGGRIAFAVTWMAAGLAFLFQVRSNAGPPLPVAIILSAVFGVVPAYVVSSAFSRMPGVRRSLRSLVAPPGRLGWYLAAILIVPADRLVSVRLARELGWGFLSHGARAGGVLDLVPVVAVSFGYTLIFAGGLNEESGWTGFALPRLQARYSPMIASVILWALWMVWHVPLQVTGMWNPNLQSLTHALVGTFFARFIFTWLYNGSKGGVWTAVLLHTSANVTGEVVPISWASPVVEGALALIVIVGARMWQRVPAGSDVAYGGGEQAA
jgi:membrane protease YdiL (CAAX protease family)